MSQEVLSELEKQSLTMFINQIPFNHVLGIELLEVGDDNVKLKLPMREQLVGNFLHGILHGGVISSVLDVAGGICALAGAIKRTRELPDNERVKLLSKIGTIDLRVDFLRPGRGEWFWACARPLRDGNKLAVSRMEFHNHEDELIAVGTGTYLCG